MKKQNKKMRKKIMNKDIKNKENEPVTESDIDDTFELKKEIAQNIGTISFLEWMRGKRLRYWGWIILYLLLLGILATQFKLIQLTSESISYKYCVQLNNVEPQKGDLCVFDYKKHTFIKYIMGVESDIVTRKGTKIYINDKFVCQTKPGNNLSAIDDVVIPKGFMFVMGTHADSLDSRYKEFGLVKVESLKGKAIGWLKGNQTQK